MKITELFESENLKSLYCSRHLTNGADLVKWAEDQGFTKCLDPKDMHVTVAFSKKKIDWAVMTDSFDHIQSTINRKHPEKTKREVKQFDGGAIVLTFENGDLHHRWEEFKEDFGASWDYPDYHPHVTITYDGLPDGMKIEDIKPFEGKLEFGPEIMKEVDLKWKDKTKEKKLDEAEMVADPTETKPFKEWFKSSKVVGPDGKPIVVYHGTSKKFRAFNIKKSTMSIIWFTSDKSAIEAGEVGAQGKGHVLSLYASIQNPADWDAYDKLGLGELKSRGFDGAILPDRNGHFTGFVFEPAQLKSATKNNGNYDRHNKNLAEDDD